jgi:membrane dipeptidase
MFALTLEEEAYFRRELAENTDIAAVCRTPDDIRKANAEGKVAAVLTIEGSELLNCDPEKIEWADEKGVRAISLTWNHPNFIAGTNLHETSRGLNDLGREFVRRCQEKDILVDVSHCSDVAFWDLMKITTKPILASHSNSRVLCNHSRNLTDDMFRAICETGGVAGINQCASFVGNTPTLDTVCDHILHWMEFDTECRHIALGADLDGCDTLTEGFNGIEGYPALAEALLRRGLTEKQVENIFWNNAMGVMEKCCT